MINKKTSNNDIIKKIKTLNKTFAMHITRNRKIDGRLNAGAGYNVKLLTEKTSFTVKYNNSRMEKDNRPDPGNILDCLFTDMYGYLNTGNYRDFCNEFGYEEYEHDYGTQKNKKAFAVYKKCKQIAERMQTMFTDKQLAQINQWLEENLSL